MPVLRRVFLVAFIACVTYLITACDSSALDARTEPCNDATCTQRVKWFLASSETAAREWYGAVIASWPAAICVSNHESATSGLYFAENSVSDASGKYQFLDSTFSNIAMARHRPDLVGHASNAVWYEQEASFGWAWTHLGPSPWAGSGCQ